jgi:hypothetical protein
VEDCGVGESTAATTAVVWTARERLVADWLATVPRGESPEVEEDVAPWAG